MWLKSCGSKGDDHEENCFDDSDDNYKPNKMVDLLLEVSFGQDCVEIKNETK